MQQIVVVSGPRQGGPGERELMFEAAAEAFGRWGIEDVTRIDVPARASGEEADDSGVRSPVAAAIPALQSGSLFGGSTGVLFVDADQLHKAEADLLAAVIPTVADDGTIGVVLLGSGALPAVLDRALKQRAELVTIKAITERTAQTWLVAAARKRSLRLAEGAAAALIRRFGSDVAALARALDQLAVAGGTVTAGAVTERFRNRPDEPMWHYTDAVASGRTGEALRRLSDFLLHGHPLQLLAYLQNDLRRRAMAASAPDYQTFLARSGTNDTRSAQLTWQAGRRARPDDLRKALAAMARADLQLKTAPEPTHRVTMERLTVALSYWYN